MSRYDVHYEVLSPGGGSFEPDNAALILDAKNPNSTSFSQATGRNAFQKLISTFKSRQKREKACSTLLCVGLSLLVLFVFGTLVVASSWRFHEKPEGEGQKGDLTYFVKGLPDLNSRRALVRRMTREAWTAYRKFAWGRDALRPLARTGYDEWTGSGTTILAGLSTLHVMGLEEEFAQGREWIRKKLHLLRELDGEVDVHSTIVQLIGGLLSAYALTGDGLLREKAAEVAELLEVAFNSTTG